MFNSVTIAAPVLLPLMSFGIVFYLILRGSPARRPAAGAILRRSMDPGSPA